MVLFWFGLVLGVLGLFFFFLGGGGVYLVYVSKLSSLAWLVLFCLCLYTWLTTGKRHGNESSGSTITSLLPSYSIYCLIDKGN